MAFSIAMIVLAALLLVVGIIGCIVPAIPGPVLAFLGLIAVAVAGGWQTIAAWLLITLGLLAIGTSIADNILPAVSSKKAGASKAGIAGSVIGMIAGSFFTPIGTIVGAFVGALVGEVAFHKENKEPLKAALGVFRGTVLAIGLKLVVTGIIGWYIVRSSIRLFA